MANKRKGKILKEIWFKSEREYNELIESVKNNETEIAINLIKNIVIRGDL